ncbi:MAG: hypothetical protein ABIL68_12855 [bacterium]
MMKKIVSLLIVSELFLTALGFCGHSHEKIIDTERCSGYHFHIFFSDCTEQHRSHSEDQDHHPEKDDFKKKLHCSCQGGFIGIHDFLTFQITLPFVEFPPQEMPSYEFLWIPFVYHPPIHSV